MGIYISMEIKAIPIPIGLQVVSHFFPSPFPILSWIPIGNPILIAISRNNLRMKFLAQNVNFKHPSFDILCRFKESSAVRKPQIWVLFQNALLFYWTLYTDCPDSSTDAVARYVSFDQITC